MKFTNRAVSALSLIACLSFSNVTLAASKEAEVIASKLVTKASIEAALAATRPLMSAAMAQVAKQQGLELDSEKEGVLMDIFMKHMVDAFVKEHPANVAAAHDKLFTPEQLRDILAFYNTPSGAAYVNKQAELVTLNSKSGAVVGQKAGQEAFVKTNALLQKEGVELFDKPELIKRLLGK